MPQIEVFRPAHLSQLQTLVNSHIGAVVPGWAVPEEFLAARLERDPGEYVVDPWVVGRTTLCAVERDRVVAAAHLLHYGDAPPVGPAYLGAGEIEWLVAWPTSRAATALLLDAAQERLAGWRVRAQWAAEGLLVPDLGGVPDDWPHVAAALRQAGFEPDPLHEEALYGGRLDGVPPPSAPPVPGLRVERRMGPNATWWSALLDDREVGWSEWELDLTRGGALPAPRGWADARNLEVDEAWRNRGIGRWLIQHAADWMRLGGCDRVILTVAVADEAAGAGRFYERFGWNVLTRLERAWAVA